MSGYEEEHNIPRGETTRAPQNRRPDLSTFYSNLEQIDTSGEHTPHTNRHAQPLPQDVSAAFRNLADFMRITMGSSGDDSDPEWQQLMLRFLVSMERDPPKEVQGVPDNFLDELERVPKSRLKKSQDCPICGNPFLDDEYPLVVRLPCHKDHLYDLDCIRPWLKVNPTCPLDRKELLKKKPPPPPVDDDDGEWDDYYA
ncbi:hypothetical protein P152DRAFT_316174 [Eremomyces bilateralis CBS 781.70]|uniref:RING-type domain-containing protein n=1 Tax=Eremomyces bilateralis CBS 781.70 TaxID=1392243 RepID=A0A6G1G5Z6_9PEZI|nr:uncharacterized protein P152DRAFT_316174 [Eremomyces bilateralis CBS 781.70]KAF1813371.1 hypothetical protein P152DRAFT_316174 [Eremomyces bilateralis CBS 781.70]